MFYRFLRQILNVDIYGENPLIEEQNTKHQQPSGRASNSLVRGQEFESCATHNFLGREASNTYIQISLK